MYIKILIRLIFAGVVFFATPVFVSATSGTCSWHEGVNCAIGSINNKVVCNDGWISNVSYLDMKECFEYNSSCSTYLNFQEFLSVKSRIKDEMERLKLEIESLESSLVSLDFEEQRALLDLNESFKGRGITKAGAQPYIDKVYRDYKLKRLVLSENILAFTNQYNDLVKKYNGICRSYTDEEKNNVCIKNFGSQTKYIGGQCIETSTCPANFVVSGDKCVCADGFFYDGSSCVSDTQYCQSKYGVGSYGVNRVCSCSMGYKMNSSKTACIKIEVDSLVNNTEKNIDTKTVSNTTAEVINEEKGLLKKIDSNLSNRVKGQILLQVEKNGEGWYVSPKDNKKYYLGRPEDAFEIMRKLGLGITEKDYNSYKGYAPRLLSGKILLRVEAKGEAYYIDPKDLKMHYLGRPVDAFDVMRKLGLGITNDDIRKINIGEIE